MAGRHPLSIFVNFVSIGVNMAYEPIAVYLDKIESKIQKSETIPRLKPFDKGGTNMPHGTL